MHKICQTPVMCNNNKTNKDIVLPGHLGTDPYPNPRVYHEVHTLDNFMSSNVTSITLWSIFLDTIIFYNL